MSNPSPLYIEEPLTMDDARAAARAIASQRREAVRWFEDAQKREAGAEHAYRVSKAKAWQSVVGEGTAGEREARVNALTADARYKRDLARGEAKAARERIAGLDGERSMLKAISDLSARTYGAAA